ncbi:MAG: ribonuclease Z [Bacteroidota bacterium]
MNFELLILGSNASAFAHKRHHTSQLLKVQNHYFLIDCGEGTQLLLKKYAVKLSKIDHILISHLHGDHYFGLIGLISTMHLFGRKKDLFLAGPVGLREILLLQLRYSETNLSFKINFVEIEEDDGQVVFENHFLTVMTLPMQHRIPCHGYLFREKAKRRRINRLVYNDMQLSKMEIEALKDGRHLLHEDGSIKYQNEVLTLDPAKSYSYAFCSDTRYVPALADKVAGVDLLYHEATFAEDMAKRAKQTYHSTAREAASIAKDASAKRLLLGHFSARYKELDILLQEAREVYPNTELAIEGLKFSPHD